jgi:hypothetical protein
MVGDEVSLKEGGMNPTGIYLMCLADLGIIKISPLL